MILRLSLLVFLVGCRNDCQQLCNTMADFAKECGETVDKKQINTCMTDNRKRNLTADQLDACDEYGDSVDEEWTCDDVEEYFD